MRQNSKELAMNHDVGPREVQLVSRAASEYAEELHVRTASPRLFLPVVFGCLDLDALLVLEASGYGILKLVTHDWIHICPWIQSKSSLS